MADAVTTRPPSPPADAHRTLQIALSVQVALGAALLALAAWLLPGDGSTVRAAAGVVAALGALGALGALPWIRAGVHRGRVTGLTLTYLLFLALLFTTMHRLEIFVGIDNLADRFARGLPFLGLAFLGFLVGSSDSLEERSALRQLGRWVLGVGLVLTAIAVGLVDGLAAIASRIVANPTTGLLVVATVIAGGALWFWLRGGTANAFGATVRQNEAINGYLLVSPNVLGFLIFLAGPLLFSLYVSFTDWSAFGDKNWVGLANYARIFGFDFATLASPTQRASEALAPNFFELTRFNVLGTNYILGAADKLFWIALRNTLVFCALVVPLSVIPALLLANILNSKIPGMKFFRAIYFLPSVAAVVGVAVIWNWLYNSTSGFINYGISQAIALLNRLPAVAITDPAIRWLSDSDTALLAIVIMAAWRIVGFNTVLYLAGLQGIPQVIYEAADVDGAGSTRKFLSITLPLLAPTTFFVVTTTLIQALQVFDEVFVLMNPPQGPNNSTLTAVLYLYQNGFQRFDQGYASAVAWVLFLLIFIVTALQFRIQRSGATAL